jgi:hypothetical protein
MSNVFFGRNYQVKCCLSLCFFFNASVLLDKDFYRNTPGDKKKPDSILSEQ